jgi:ABC-2 type transport system permease protein
MSLMSVQWVGLMTMIRKERVRILRIWTQTLLPSVITTTLYFLIFGRFIGSKIGMLHGVPYIQFIVPGLIMMSVLTNSYANVTSSVFSAKFQKQIEELLVSPLHSLTMMLGYLSGGLLRGLLIGILVTAVSLFFSPIQVHSFAMIAATIVLTAVLFSLAGIINALYAKKFDDIAIVPTFVLTPLTYLGGVFYSVKSLPPIWQKISYLNPILYLVNLFRYGFLGMSDVPVIPSFLGLVGIVVVLWAVAYYLFVRGIGVRQ